VATGEGLACSRKAPATCCTLLAVCANISRTLALPSSACRVPAWPSHAQMTSAQVMPVALSHGSPATRAPIRAAIREPIRAAVREQSEPQQSERQSEQQSESQSEQQSERQSER
jgi:hypothetical protein